MRTFMPSRRPAIGHLLACALLFPVTIVASEIHSVESEVRLSFPSLSLQSSAAFDPSDTAVNGRLVSGLRVRKPADETLEVQYPLAYDAPIVVSFGSQRLVLRAVGADAAFATETAGKLLYERPYPFIDSIEVPRGGRSEELLLIRDRRAPHVIEYEIVESEGIARVVLDSGAVRFLPALATIPAGRFSQPTRSLQIDRPWMLDASGSRSESHAHWSLVGDAAIPARIRLTWTDDDLSYPLVIDPSFSATGSLAFGLRQHTATLLQNGKVLIAGGTVDDNVGTNSAELCDPVTGTCTVIGNMVHYRFGHTATLLQSGKVFIAGGTDESGNSQPWTELYDPDSETFSQTGAGAMGRRSLHTATLLQNGQVLIAGGYDNDTDSDLSDVILYDPGTANFLFPVASLATARERHTATLLPNGQVLIAGGSHRDPSNFFYINSGELFDPSNYSVSPTVGNMAVARVGHSATLIPQSGKVLIAGGANSVSKTNTVELYDPASKTFSSDATPSKNLTTARYRHTATLLPSGNVLIAGGDNGAPVALAEVYNAVLGTFSSPGSLATARFFHTATLLPNGRVLVAGGAYTSSCELYDPNSPKFKTTTGSLTDGRYLHTATLLPNGKVLIAGGSGSGGALPSAELYDPSFGTFAATGSLTTGRYFATSTLLLNGKVLVAGGSNGGSLGSAELFDPAAGSFGAKPATLVTARNSHTATLLQNGQVLIVGGSGAGGVLGSAELYDPIAGTFSATGSLTTPRQNHTATLLPNGKVLIIGGTNFISYFGSAELYDPITRTFSTAPGLITPRAYHTATLLPNGKVLIAGGQNASGSVPAGQLFNPGGGSVATTGNMVTPRRSHSATLLPNGRVLIASGYNGAYLGAAEVYDPAAGTFTATDSLGEVRDSHTATLLTDGTVLIAGGTDGSNFLTSAEFYDVGQGYPTSRRPVISSGPFAGVSEPSTMTLGGSEFAGDFESSGGCGSSNSSTNYPLLQIQRIDNEQISNVPPSAAWSDSTFTSKTLTGLANGFYRVAIVTNSIPSTQRLISIAYPAPTITTTSFTAGPASGGQSLTITGTHLDNLWNVTLGGAVASVITGNATSITVTTPAGTPGASTLAVNTAGGTAKRAYTYVVLPAPASITATAITTTSVSLSWPAVAGASSYDIARSTTDGAFSGIIQTGVVGTTAIDSTATNGGSTGPTANNAYFYIVRAYQASSATTSAFSPPDLATTVIFTDDTLSGIPTKEVHITQLQTAVRAVHIVCGLGTVTFTTVTSGVTHENASLITTELRAKLDEARAAKSLPAVTYTDPTIVAGSTIIKAQHILDLRSGVQ